MSTAFANKPSLPPKGTVVLEARRIVKRYGHVTALAGADLELRAGEILAIVGDNGAGKSTLIKVLCGAVVPDEGEVFLDGAPVHFRSPLDARRLGIETVYQDLAVAPALDIATNLFKRHRIQIRRWVEPAKSCAMKSRPGLSAIARRAEEGETNESSPAL
jgi:fructose transport system ATP-binding protein